jgi:hypothetical protein
MVVLTPPPCQPQTARHVPTRTVVDRGRRVAAAASADAADFIAGTQDCPDCCPAATSLGNLTAQRPAHRPTNCRGEWEKSPRKQRERHRAQSRARRDDGASQSANGDFTPRGSHLVALAMRRARIGIGLPTDRTDLDGRLRNVGRRRTPVTILTRRRCRRVRRGAPRVRPDIGGLDISVGRSATVTCKSTRIGLELWPA